MKLWLLRPHEKYDTLDIGPWSPWYDKMFGFVVRAETEEDARLFADKSSGEESTHTSRPWLSPRYSTCTELTADGEAGVVIHDFARA